MLYQTENPHGGDRYSCPIRLDFSANINPLGTPGSVRQAVVRSVGRLDHYPDPYCMELVQSIAVFEKLPSSYVLCGCGAAELIYSYCAAKWPKRAMELAPAFSEYSSALENVNCEIIRYALSSKQQFLLDEAFLPVLEQERPDVLFLCNPNNPTGQLVPTELMERIVTVCSEKEIALFVDECFLDMTDNGEVSTLKSYLAEMPGLFILKAFTKSFGMAGLRLGYGLCSDKKLLKAMGRSVQPWNISIPAQAAGVAALGEQMFLEQARTIIAEERRWLKGELEQLGAVVCPSAANFLLFYSELPLYEKLLERGIRIRPCENYHGLTKGWYRIAVKLHEENRILMNEIRTLTKESLWLSAL